MTSRRWASSASANCLRVMVLRSAVTSTRPGSTSMTGRFLSAKDLRSGTGFQPGSKSRWQRTSRVVHCPGASLFSRCASMPWSCALSCAQALFVRPRRSLTFAHAMARTSHQLDSTLLAEEPAPLHLRRVREAEGLHDGVAHVVGGRIRRVGHQEVVQVRGLDRALLEQRAAKEIEERLPELGAHQHDGEVADLAGLDERRGLADLIERPEPAGQGDEGVGILHEHDLADVEVAERHPPVEVRVRLLLLRQLDVAADGPPARLPGAAVGALHDARAAARHHREAVARQARADLPRHLVVPVLVRHAGRAKHGDAGPDEMQRAEAADELGEDAQRAKELDEPWLGTRQEAVLFGIRAAFAPAPAARRAQLHLGSHGISPSAPTPSGMAAGPHGGQRQRARELGQRRLDETLRWHGEGGRQRLDGLRVGGALVHHDLEATVAAHALQCQREARGGRPLPARTRTRMRDEERAGLVHAERHERGSRGDAPALRGRQRVEQGGLCHATRRKRPRRDARRAGTGPSAKSASRPKVSNGVAASTRPEPWSSSPNLGWPAKVSWLPSRPRAVNAGTAWRTSPSAPGWITRVSTGSAMRLHYPRKRLTNLVGCGIVRFPAYA